MKGPMCRKGKSCGATCIDARERCNIELGPLVSPAVGKTSMTLGALFNQGIAAGKERAPSVPADLKQQLAALGGLQPEKPKGPTSATGNTKWARGDAGDFDKNFKIYKRIRGEADMVDWDETVKNGKKIGEGSFGTVLRVGNVAHKRGEVGGQEAEIIRRVGEAGIGPKLIGGEISTKQRDGFGVDLHNGRIAMSVVPGKELGDVRSDTKIAGKNAADIYWKSMADLHRLGIAHNDAHPHNLLVDDAGKGRWVDMGLAQASPRAALAEAMGSFKERKGGDDISVPGRAGGQGNWQTMDWDATGAKSAQRAFERGGDTWKEYKERFPVAARVWENNERVVRKLEGMGMDVNDINSMIAHGIRSPLDTYDKSGGFSRITDKQAQDLLNTLYDGI